VRCNLKKALEGHSGGKEWNQGSLEEDSGGSKWILSGLAQVRP
jgi:hypothetical protein